MCVRVPESPWPLDKGNFLRAIGHAYSALAMGYTPSKQDLDVIRWQCLAAHQRRKAARRVAA